MELKIKYRHILLLVGTFALMLHEANAQVEVSAKLRGRILKVEFYNKSDKSVKVPDLSARYGVDKIYLFEDYYNISNDTLQLFLTEELDSDLYTIKSREQNDGVTNAKLKYTDKVLLPGKTYRSKIRLNETNNIKFF